MLFILDMFFFIFISFKSSQKQMPCSLNLDSEDQKTKRRCYET